MPTFKLIIADPKTGKSESREVKDAGAQLLMGRRIGDVMDGGPLGLTSKLVITGGSDRAGFPMRADVLGGGKNYVLLTEGVGFRNGEEGVKKRRLVRGGTITEEIYQINAKKMEEPVKAE
jgi:small subunit ribosomal protein S6e